MKNIEYINAGAGSGKTYTLTQRLVKFLDGTEGNYNPGEVILTTYTELAANEFKEKSREALLKAKLFEQAAQLETAAIGTVHAVAYRFVKKYWYLLGRGANDNVMSEADKKFYINQSLANIAKEEDILFFDELMKEFNFVKEKKENPDFWKNDLRNIIEKMEQFEIENPETSRLKSKALIDSIFCKDSEIDISNTRLQLERYIEVCGNATRRNLVQNFLLLKIIRYVDLNNIASLDVINSEKKKLPEIDILMAHLAECIRGRLYGEKLKSYIDKIFDIAIHWKIAFNDYKAKNRMIDYNDMEQLFLHLLNQDAVIDEISGKFKLVFVDEFQDSSPVQVKIFSRLSELVDKSIWVGDPKQAIYGFRGSDAQLIKSITAIFSKGNKERGLQMGDSLKTSYRSRAELVELSNQVFKRTFTDMSSENICLNANRVDENEFGTEASKALLHWHFEFAKPVDQPNARANKADHYSNLAQQVINLLRSELKVFDKEQKKIRSVQPEDIAILARTNINVNDISSALTKYGLKVVSKNGVSVIKETAEFKLFMAILNYMQNKSNDLAKAEILYLIDAEKYSVEQIIESRMSFLEKNDAAQDDQFMDLAERILLKWEAEHPFLLKIDELRKMTNGLPVPDLVEVLICNLDLGSLVTRWGERERRNQNLNMLISEAKNYDNRCLQMGLGASLNNFIVHLTNAATFEVKMEMQKGAVNVLTYHSAKGLEWNVVILESLDNDELSQNDLIAKSFFGVRDILTKTPSLEQLFPERYIQLLPWFAGAKNNLKEDFVNLIVESDVFKSNKDVVTEEVKRLMYVGVTRARDYLITTSYHTNELKWLENIGCNPIKPSNCNEMLIDLWTTGKSAHFKSSVNDDSFNKVSNVWDETSLAKSSNLLNFESRYISPSNIASEVKADVELLHNFEERITISGTKNDKFEDVIDALTGTVLHNILCVYSPEKTDNFEKAKSILSGHLMRSVFINPEKIIQAAENLYRFLSTEYGSAITVYKELPIQKKLSNGQIVRGSIDMVWETENEYILVDYKSFPGSISQVLNSDSEHFAGIYASQLKTYCDVLSSTGKTVKATLLYYVVSGCIVEVKFL